MIDNNLFRKFPEAILWSKQVLLLLKRFFLSDSLSQKKEIENLVENKSEPVFLLLLYERQWKFAASKFIWILNVYKQNEFNRKVVSVIVVSWKRDRP